MLCLWGLYTFFSGGGGGAGHGSSANSCPVDWSVSAVIVGSLKHNGTSGGRGV